jgi:hypothetical protein
MTWFSSVIKKEMESVDPTLKKVNDKKTQLQTKIYFPALFS